MSASPFDIGAVVVDREASPSRPTVVVALPARPADEWITYGGMILAHANPGYPADAPVVLVVDAADVATYLAEWDHETPLPQPALDERGVYYRAVPAPRLTTAESDGNDDSDRVADGAGDSETDTM